MKKIIFFLLLGGIANANAQDTRTIETILPFTNEYKTITVKEEDSTYIYGGDILVKKKEKPAYYDYLIAKNKDVIEQAVATGRRYSLWRNGIMPYVISPNMPERKRAEILEAIETINAQTKVTIQPRKYERDYVYIAYSANECNSYVGRIGGQQLIRIADGCGTGSVMHEFFHAFGFYHEHNRPDRDRYIKVNYHNMSSFWATQFEKVNHTAKVYGKYDYESIMHYGRSNNWFTCYNHTACEKVGNRKHLSQLDIEGMNKLYHFATPVTPPVSPVAQKKVPVYLSTSLGEKQIIENVYVKINNEKIRFAVSYQHKNDGIVLLLEEGKEYTYEVFVDCIEYEKLEEGRYLATTRRGAGNGKFTAKNNKKLSLVSNRRSTQQDYNAYFQ